MAGQKVHDATGSQELMEVIRYRIGLWFPDRGKKLKDKEEYLDFFKRHGEEPPMEYDEFVKYRDDLHFGYSSDPNIQEFLNWEAVDLTDVFWRGYFTHVLGDKLVYERAVKMEQFDKDYLEKGDGAKKVLHKDWDLTNTMIHEKYGIELLPEVEASGVVQYETGTPVYVDPEKMIEVIELLRNSSLEEMLEMVQK